VRLARKLAAHAQVAEAFGAGRVSAEQAEVIASAAGAMPATVRAEAETRLLEAAQSMHPGELAKQARRVAVDLDPTAAARLAAEEWARRRRREFSIVANNDGAYALLGQLDVEGAATLSAALDPLAAPRPSTADGPDPRTPAQRRGEALVELARRALPGDTLPDGGGVRPRVVVTMTLDQLRGHREGMGRFDGGPITEPVPSSMARRIACDAGILPAVLGGSSEVLDLGRERRLATPAQRKALAIRDGGCAFPGCDRPPQWTDAHHIKAWAHGGATDLDNLVLLCGPHHDLAHHGWIITLDPDRRPLPTTAQAVAVTQAKAASRSARPKSFTSPGTAQANIRRPSRIQAWSVTRARRSQADQSCTPIRRSCQTAPTCMPSKSGPMTMTTRSRPPPRVAASIAGTRTSV
jgi:hypothetical protein